MMTKRKMPAVLLAGLMILAIAGCNANKATPDSGTAADSRITETVTDFTPETTVDTALPADTENKTEATAEKEKAESSAPAESGTAAETRKPAESADKAETVPPTQAPKQSEPPEATEPPESRPAESTAPTAPPAETKPETEPPAETQPPNGFTEADHNRIVSEVKAYAESYKAKGFTFEWSDSLEFGWDVGWMGTPRISRDGVDGTIKTLKHHVDLIYKSGTDPANGVTADSVLYRVVQLEIDGGIAYAVIYG
jgi:hypothetical protein